MIKLLQRLLCRFLNQMGKNMSDVMADVLQSAVAPRLQQEPHFAYDAGPVFYLVSSGMKVI
jgi:2-hydroxy-3-keto-5-methylthiopentenyl-1-phosphate phosphatase